MSKQPVQRELIPQLRFPEFRHEPEWNSVAIGTYLTESCDKGSAGNRAKKLTVKLWGKGVFEKEEAIQGSVNTQYYRRRAGQFIYSKLDFLNQAFGVIPDYLDGFESTVDLPCFDVKSGLDRRFLLEYVKRNSFYKKVGEIADGGRKARRIQIDTFLGSPIVLPPNPIEQLKIADCLGSLDDLIVAEGRKLELLKDHKNGLMQQLFPRPGESQPERRFPEFQTARGWEQESLAKLCTAPISYGIVQAGPHMPDGMPYIKSTDLNAPLSLDRLSRTSTEIAAKYRRSEVVPGDLVFSLRGNIGVSQIVPESIRVANLTQGTARVRSRESSSFIFYALSSAHVQEQVAAVSKGSTLREISLADLRELMVPHPKPAEQCRIADCLSSLDTRLAAYDSRLKTLCMHKRGLIQQLFPSLEESGT